MFSSNVIIDLSYNLSNCIQFEVSENCLKWVAYINTLFSPCRNHQHTVLALSLGSKWKVAQTFAYPNNSCIFYRPELNL